MKSTNKNWEEVSSLVGIIRVESVVALGDGVLGDSLLVDLDLILGLLDDLGLTFVISQEISLWNKNCLAATTFVVVNDFHSSKLVFVDLFAWEGVDLNGASSDHTDEG